MLPRTLFVFLTLLLLPAAQPLILSRRAALEISLTFASTISDSSSSTSATSQQPAYDGYASTYDLLDDKVASSLSFLGLSQGRSDLLSNSYGSVLEICAGTGINLPYYPKRKLKSLTMLDISPNMLKLAEERNESYPCENVKFDVADITDGRAVIGRYGEGAFDTIVDTFSLCVLDTETVRTLELVRRLIKPDGKILLFENARADNSFVGAYQDLTAQAIAKKGGGKGCVFNQRVDELVKEAGLTILDRNDYAGGLFRAYVCGRGG
ncbi:hypothetical protein TrVE_jg13401 [Triparma verrucosa]|uniref:Methyltransferase domain-containing protein n=1 Tax=Triparma verrucosa TaxID=1606542 RepID=A0A9W7KWB3_9STRA|nr:hypothetical protein TrVE_jg13401 [Triparma verrucosa]